MASDWKATLKRMVVVIGKSLLFMATHLLRLLVRVGRFIALKVIPAVWSWLRRTALPAVQRFYVRLPHRRAVTVGLSAVVVLVIAASVIRRPGADDPSMAAAANVIPDQPVILTLSPLEGPSGAAIALVGLAWIDHAPLEVTIGGQPSSATWLADGTLQTRVPLYPGPDNWPAPPAKPQVVEVHRRGRLIAKSRDGLRITALQRAPGSTAKVQRSLKRAVDSYERIFEALPAQDDQEMAHRRALLAVLRGLVHEGDHSMAAILAGTSPLLKGGAPNLDLVDALMASSGTAANMDALAKSLGAAPVSAGAASPMLMSLPIPPTGPKCRAGGKDMELACLMQVQGLLDDLSTHYIRPTADAWANFTLLAVGNHPASVMISALMSVTNLVMGKVAPALLPAALTRFELEVRQPLIAVNEMTRSRIIVAARNEPQSITVDDLVDVVKSTVGPLVKFKNEDIDRLKDFFFRVIDLYSGALRGVDAAKPGTAAKLQADVFVIPAKTWGPFEVTSSDLVTLFSYDEQVVSSQEKELQWRGEQAGQSKVRVMPRSAPGERSKILRDHTLCWGCVWSGGAFGTDMPESSKEIAVDIELRAHPQQGRAPLNVRFRWNTLARAEGDMKSCSLDFGDGSPVERIADCTKTTSFDHTYMYTSRLKEDTGGGYEATLRLDRSNAAGKAEVFTEWTFRGSPETGEAPLGAKFSWDIPWPADVKAPACEFDPGDGSKRQRFDDCLATSHTEHRFDRRGSFVPTLTLVHRGARDTKTAPVSLAEAGTCDESLLEHRSWVGTVSYSSKRDVWDPRGGYHVTYSANVSLGDELVERTRRQFRGADHLVQYYSPLPTGSAALGYSRKDYSTNLLTRRETFTGSGPMQRQEKHMGEDGSSLSLTLDSLSCTYKFYLQGQVMGSGEIWDKFDGAKPVGGYRWINSVHGEGLVTSSKSIRGSAPFPLMSRTRIENNSIEKTTWARELDSVVKALGEDNLGNLVVEWEFAPKD